MRKFKFAKLVRDKISENIKSSGGIVDSRILSDLEFITQLKLKLVEEVSEISSESGAGLVEELADLQEIIDQILLTLKVSQPEFLKIMAEKNTKAGSFKNREYINHIEVPEDCKWIDYYLKHPDKYPEIKK